MSKKKRKVKKTKKKAEVKRRVRVYRSVDVIKKIIKQYEAAPHGKKVDVLRKHGISFAHISYWKRNCYESR